MENEPKSNALEERLSRMGAIGRLLLVFVTSKHWWLAPLVLALLLMLGGLALVFALDYAAPYVYVAF